MQDIFYINVKCIELQVVHNKNREINTNKIQKMVEGYVKKYRMKEKKKGG